MFGRVVRNNPIYGIARTSRLFSTTPVSFNNILGDLTKPEKEEFDPLLASTNNSNLPRDQITAANDKALQEFYHKEALENQIRSDKYVSPLKRRLFNTNVATNGFFKNEQIVKDKESGKSYKLSLTPEEIDILEPSIYLESYRIKSSTKKATLVNRFVRGMPLLTAINQLHFNPKKMATEVEKLLKQGVSQATELGYNPEGMFIQAIWTGSDGNWVKRLDFKGRGRIGLIKHTYIHVKCILKTEQTSKRLAWEKEQRELANKPRMFLNNEPLNFSVRALYKW
ncbi:54S ribosomal protein L22, mitochondrial [Scheffersomyces spartinae]|uniref:54S ribosomal protein L22, mitochondrial n=1 Tax=Scheffersomyces spartinae TaxID=45513 RepID=A0A9P7V9Q4_9ASCO|nr:54S ribosomal protein L22, mitochondrial [Scheffersomyces spartinae]KAG7193947.1 54S ribosomal protein L22, mitochondrial [Scheffersomyces spartinae]